MRYILTGVAALFVAMSLIVAGKTSADTWLEQFEFKCEVPSEDVRVEDVRAGAFTYSEAGYVIPSDGKIGGIFYSNIRDYREDCHDEINRSIAQCRETLLSLSPPFDPTSETDADEIDNPIHGRCYPILERQRRQCVEHFRRERAKCDAGSDDTRQETQASDAQQVDEVGAGESSEDTLSASDAWKPWEDETTVDDGENGEDAQWVEVEDPDDIHSEYEPDDGDDNCEDAWADCPRDTYWTEEQQEGARQVELWVNYADPQANAETDHQDDGWGYEANEALEATGESGDAVDDTREDYERALAGLLNEGEPSAADPYSASDDDYRAVLEEMDAQAEAEEKARIETKRAAAEAAAEQERQEAARRAQEEEQRSSAGAGSSGGGMESKGDGLCGDTPVCRDYALRGRQMLTSLQNAIQSRSLDMTGTALSFGLEMRITMACFRKCAESGLSAFCTREFELQLDEFDRSYRSAIDSARASSAGSSYVEDFDRDPTNSQFVRDLGVQIVGASVDSCGD